MPGVTLSIAATAYWPNRYDKRSKLVRVFLDYLRIEYLWPVLIMSLTNRNGIR
jgi:hypothetical protein